MPLIILKLYFSSRFNEMNYRNEERKELIENYLYSCNNIIRIKYWKISKFENPFLSFEVVFLLKEGRKGILVKNSKKVRYSV